MYARDYKVLDSVDIIKHEAVGQTDGELVGWLSWSDIQCVC